MRVILMPAARDDIRAAYAYYMDRSPASADRAVGAILKAANGLAQLPLLGAPGKVPGTRERIVVRCRYRIVYHIVGDTIEVLRVLHGAQQWP